jgi:hypothetical protein
MQVPLVLKHPSISPRRLVMFLGFEPWSRWVSYPTPISNATVVHPVRNNTSNKLAMRAIEFPVEITKQKEGRNEQD